MDWTVTADIAQVIATILIGIGVIVSLIIGIRTVHQMQESRSQAVRPYLSFSMGGRSIPVTVREAQGLMGLLPTPQLTNECMRRRPDGKRLYADHPWGYLINYGNGPAIDVHITFHIVHVYMELDDFSIDEKKRSEFPYITDVDLLPFGPSRIMRVLGC